MPEVPDHQDSSYGQERAKLEQVIEKEVDLPQVLGAFSHSTLIVAQQLLIDLIYPLL